VRPRISVLQNTVRKICQLTGQEDRERKTPAFNQTEQRFGSFGTDLGYSFEHPGVLWFSGILSPLHPGHPMLLTPSPSTTATQPEPGIPLDFKSIEKQYTSPRLLAANGAKVDTGSFEGPVAGLSADGDMYIIYTTDRTEEGSGDNGLVAFWIGQDGGIGTSWANPVVDSGKWRPALPIVSVNSVRLILSLRQSAVMVTRLMCSGLLPMAAFIPPGAIPASTPTIGILRLPSPRQAPIMQARRSL
jgi:hypothetical protein